jgi:hypothetical protein
LLSQEDYVRHSTVRYRSDKGIVEFSTDDREHELFMTVRSVRGGASVNLHGLPARTLGFTKKQINSLVPFVKGSYPVSVQSWLATRVPLITEILSSPRLWEHLSSYPEPIDLQGRRDLTPRQALVLAVLCLLVLTLLFFKWYGGVSRNMDLMD